MKNKIIHIFIIIFSLFISHFSFAANTTDLFIEGGYSLLNFAGDDYMGGNAKISLIDTLSHQTNSLDIVLGTGFRIEKTSFLNQEKYYGYVTTINSYEIGLITGIKYKIIPELRFYLLPVFYYAPSTDFENKIYLNNTNIIKRAEVDYNFNSGLDLKLIYKVFNDVGIGLDVYAAYGYMKYNDTSFYSLSIKGSEGGFFIYNFNASIVYFIK